MSVRYLVPERVINYIEYHKLYEDSKKKEENNGKGKALADDPAVDGAAEPGPSKS